MPVYSLFGCDQQLNYSQIPIAIARQNGETAINGITEKWQEMDVLITQSVFSAFLWGVLLQQGNHLGFHRCLSEKSKLCLEWGTTYSYRGGLLGKEGFLRTFAILWELVGRNILLAPRDLGTIPCNVGYVPAEPHVASQTGLSLWTLGLPQWSCFLTFWVLPKLKPRDK